jgi:hypothetical protein
MRHHTVKIFEKILTCLLFISIQIGGTLNTTDVGCVSANLICIYPGSVLHVVGTTDING